MEYAPIDTATAVAAPAFFTCDAAELSAACDYLSRRVVERRNTIPIVECLLIEASLGIGESYSGGSITITATDLDLAASITLAAIVESPGAFCTPAYALAETLAKVKKASKGAQVSFDHTAPELDNMNRPKADRVTVKSGRGRYQLGALPRDDFPAIPLSAEVDLIAFALPAGQFFADLAAVGSCASKEETRYYLNGAALQVRELAGQDRLCLVATDGHAIAVASRPIPIGATDLGDMILPSKTMAIIGHAAKLAGDADVVRVTAYGMKLAFEFGAVRIVSKMIDGTFPDWTAPFADRLAASDASPALFPELLPGAPVATIERIAKAAKGMAIDWNPASQGMLGTVAGDDGLLFGAVNMADGGACQRKGFDYHWQGRDEAALYLLALARSRGLPDDAEMLARADAINAAWGEPTNAHYNGEAPFGRASAEGPRTIMQGTRVVGMTFQGEHKRASWSETVTDWEALAERTVYHPSIVDPIGGSYSILMPADGPGQLVPESAIIGPDGIEYPVAMSEAAIHLSKEQVRALVGESCFEVMAVPVPEGHPLHWSLRGKPAYVARWLYEQGDSRLLTVDRDGRCFNAAKHGRDYLARDEIDALIAGTWRAEGEGAIPETGGDYAEVMPQPVAVECEASESVTIDRDDYGQHRVLYRGRLASFGGAGPDSLFKTKRRARAFADWLIVTFGTRLDGAFAFEPGEREQFGRALAAIHAGEAPGEASEAPEPIATACQPCEAVGSGESVALDSGEGGKALSEALAAPEPEYHRLQNTSPEETAALLPARHGKRIDAPAPVAVITGESRNSDPDLAAMVADLAARVAAIEAGQGLSVESAATHIAKPARTAAHERAVRRAWAERKGQRSAQAVAAMYCRRMDSIGEERDAERETARDAAKWCNHWKREHDMRAAADRASARIAEEALGEVRALNAALAIARQDVAEASQRAEQFARRGNRHAEARRRSTMLAREMQQRAAHYRAKWKEEERRAGAAEGKRRGSTVLARYRGGQMVELAGVVKRQAGEAAQVKRTMADPTMPERSSDIARLVEERDQARNANAALEQRCARMQSAVDGCAGTIEALASRVAVAEAALRKAA